MEGEGNMAEVRRERKARDTSVHGRGEDDICIEQDSHSIVEIDVGLPFRIPCVGGRSVQF